VSIFVRLIFINGVLDIITRLFFRLIRVLESGPMGSSHATRSSWRLLVAARSPWKHVGGGRLRQSGSMAKHFPL
jgi:hypothetical protein